MKKLAVLLAVLVMLLAASGCALAEISIDFSERTNGVWSSDPTANLAQSNLWEDDIYTSSLTINSDLDMLVPSGSDLSVTEGWNADGTVLVSDYSIYANLTGLIPGEVYRMAYVIPQYSGSTAMYHEYCVAEKDGEAYFNTGMVSLFPGVYPDITLIVTGGGEVFTHTFSLQIQSTNSSLYDYIVEYGVRSGLYYESSNGYAYTLQRYLRKAGYYEHQRIGQPMKLSVPQKGDVFTGFDSMKTLEVEITLGQKYAWDWKYDFEAEYTLKNKETGEIVAQERTDADLNGRDSEGIWWATADLAVENIPAGEYSVEVELFRFVRDESRPEEYIYLPEKSLGKDSTTFFIEKEFDPIPIYESYSVNKLRLDMADSWGHKWSLDGSVVSVSEYSTLELRIEGMQPDVSYRAVLTGVNAYGEEFTAHVPVRRSDANSGIASVEFASRNGTYEDLTLMVVGGGELLTHTFDVVVALEEEAEYEYGLMYGETYELEFNPIGGESSTFDREGSLEIALNDGNVFSGFPGLELKFLIRFGEDLPDKWPMTVKLTSVETGETVAQEQPTVQNVAGETWQWRLLVDKPFADGEYILSVQIKDASDSATLTLKNEPDPMAAIAEYQAMLAAMPSYSEKGVIVYKPEESIIPEIHQFLEGMESFDTDRFNSFLRYSHAGVPEQMIRSFAIHSPNVQERETVVDLEDVLFTANCALQEIYSFQLHDMADYTEATVLDTTALMSFFGGWWRELVALDFAAGTTVADDGTVYTWLPVYFADAEQGFEKDELYLFVYVQYPGADAAYLDATGYYNPEFYNEYHTTQLLITDQAAVAEMLRKLDQVNSALQSPSEDVRYSSLRMGSQGEMVRRMQVQLKKLGYLQSSVDAVFSYSVQEAVSAWQTAEGKEPTGVVSAEELRALLDTTAYRQMLADWLAVER